MKVKNTLRYLFCLAPFLFLAGQARAQNWQLVWADEFNGSIGPDWTFQTGGGGWGNNELEYYQQQNASIVNFGGASCLAITARQESVGGYNYTSARMTTQGHKSWKYGKIVARVALPTFQGSWPAFWMLGDNIGSVGWPQCGELDVMEQINTSWTIYGSTHWWANNAQADYSGNTSVDLSNWAWHEYSVIWDSQYIRWYVDGNQYNQFYIGGNAGQTDAFNNNNFFIILNMAVGGNWPGFSVDNSRLPASMYVDYVRVYQDAPQPVQGTYGIGSYGDMNTALQCTNETYYDGSGYVSGCKEVAVTPYSSTNIYQNWIVTPIGGGQYHIINQYDGLALQATNDAYYNGSYYVAGCDKVALTPSYWNSGQQVWLFNNAGQGYSLANPANSQNLQASQDSYLGLGGCYQVLGSPYSWGVGANQQWNVVWYSN